ncbi:GspH/FimT family pseudopilin [Noviherbaspirillum saxi]|uniref:Type II secretion system protein H n=1 Tax=Noviherbaspirillum saxi TaxID=2320863 RepID=A0A3A3FXJ7_9BURK|nr:GspH/FimT family pseudopilin [Noviherbaspirillum saxi]RJG00085.1 prepilin-type N-terminal cleavage/methylation domain-containing protein [Noviherbaspirillum saxi]
MLKTVDMQRGVSLIEIMIGLAIVAMLFAAAAPNYATFIQNSQVRNAADALQTGLGYAKAEAVRRNTFVQLVLGADYSWTVGCQTPVVDPDADDGMELDCPATIQTRSANDGSRNAVITPTPAAPSTIVFNGLGRTTLAANASYDITNPSGGTCAAAGGKIRCLSVVVTTAGQVRMCDPALTISKPTDPQAC